jgi:predicted dehydrogenase
VKTLNGALVGFGQVAQNAHAPAFRGREDFNIAAVADADPERLRLAAAALPGVRTYPSLEALLAAENNLDFVDLATPPWLHGKQVLAALDRGLHVLCEKPLTLSREEFRRVAARSRLRGRTVFTVHNWAYSPIWTKLRELVTSGALGEVRHVQLHALRTKPAANAGPGDWRTDAHLAGGGILVDHGWHNLYLLRRCLNGSSAAPLQTQASFHRPTPGAAEDEATVFYAFPAATALLRLSWRAAARSNWALLQGSDAALELRDDHLLLTRGTAPPQRFDFPQKLSAGSAHPEWLSAMLPDFYDEVTDLGARGRNLEEAGFALDLIRRAYGAGGERRSGRVLERAPS